MVDKVIRGYKQCVPQEIRDTFRVKVSDLEESLKAREFLERIVTRSIERVERKILQKSTVREVN